MKKIISSLMVLVLMFSFGTGAFAQVENGNPEVQVSDYQAGLFAAQFATKNELGLYEYNEQELIDIGASEQEATYIKEYFENMDAGQVLMVESAKRGEIQYVFPAIPVVLIPIGKYLIGAVGAVIINEVIQYGIGKACQKLKGKYGFFTDFCKTRGYIK
ncbi:hypothetical protein OCA08_22505 [Bacillus cereus]|nr:hypothetical protein [Bacillus cereus]